MNVRSRTILVSAATLALCAAPLAAQAEGATIYVNNATGSSTDANCVAAIVTHPTIQSAVSDASSGDTIVVCPSTYSENVTDNGKSLTFQGAQQSVDANGRTGPESIVDGATGTAFTLSGSGSSVDGFTLSGATSGDQTPAVLVQGTGESANNTIFTDDGQAAIILSSDTTFANDLVRAPSGGNAGGFFFNSNQGANSTVKNNTFTGNLPNAAVNVADPTTPIDGLSITGNTFDASAGGNFAVLGGTRNVVIQGNTVTGGAASGTAILLLGDDAGYSITQNTVTGVNASAVSVAGGFGYATNGGGDISQNAFKHNLRGINVTDDAGTITAHLNILVGNNTGGTPTSPNAAIRNTTSAAVSAANNYFGCNGGPGANGCDDVLGSVNANPFLVLSTTVDQASIPANTSTGFTADLNHNSAGDLVSGHVLDNVENAAFSFTGGTVNPASAPIVGGTASTTLTAGSATGQFDATATVENSTSTKTVTVTAASTGDGSKPRISMGDATTVEGNSGTHAIKFPVRLSKSYKSAVSMHYATADGSAKAGSDYVAKSGTLSIKAGSRVGYISVLVKGDKTKEPSESFFVTISNAKNGSIADPNGSGVIQNDDK
jgi:hypothetical protein